MRMKHQLELNPAALHPPKACSFKTPPLHLPALSGASQDDCQNQSNYRTLKKIDWQLLSTYYFQSLLLRTLDGSLHFSVFNKVGTAISPLLQMGKLRQRRDLSKVIQGLSGELEFRPRHLSPKLLPNRCWGLQQQPFSYC